MVGRKINDNVHYDLAPEDLKGRDVLFRRGADSQVWRVEGLNSVIARLRDYDNVQRLVIPELVKRRITSDGSTGNYDDRKHSLREVRAVGDDLIVVRLSMTYYQAHDADIRRSDEENIALQKEGEQIYGDRWAYHARNIGVAVTPVTLDGHVFVGERINTRLYQGWLNAAAGNKTWSEQSGSLLKQFLKDALNEELRREYGQSIEAVGEPEFVGIASHPLKGDADATWVVRINKRDSFFESGEWLKDRKDKEHDAKLVKITKPEERDQLVNNFFAQGRQFPGVMYSTDLGLRALTERYFTRLE
ncbi:MAG TPA: hypothetical protein VJI98_00270 [Candidatus Nanoarchaeia archaeon]|nr:hypothetical protein [Candidatus Nanoarchaeia archaeon]